MYEPQRLPKFSTLCLPTGFFFYPKLHLEGDKPHKTHHDVLQPRALLRRSTHGDARERRPPGAPRAQREDGRHRGRVRVVPRAVRRRGSRYHLQETAAVLRQSRLLPNMFEKLRNVWMTNIFCAVIKFPVNCRMVFYDKLIKS